MSEARTEKVIIRLSPTEKNELKYLAESQGFKSLSVFIRKSWTHVKPWTPEDVGHKQHVRLQVAQACNDLHQLAKVKHQNNPVDVLLALSVIRALLEELL